MTLSLSLPLTPTSRGDTHWALPSRGRPSMAILLSLPTGLAAGRPALESGTASPEPEGPLSFHWLARLTVPSEGSGHTQLQGTGLLRFSSPPFCPSALGDPEELLVPIFTLCASTPFPHSWGDVLARLAQRPAGTVGRCRGHPASTRPVRGARRGWARRGAGC